MLVGIPKTVSKHLKGQVRGDYRDQNLPFRKFQQEKRLKILGDLFRVKIR